MSKSKIPEHLKGVSTTGGAFKRTDAGKFERDAGVQQTTGAPEAKPKAAPAEPAPKRTTKG